MFDRDACRPRPDVIAELAASMTLSLRFDEVFNFLVYRLYLPDVGLLRERVENIHYVEEFSGILGPR